MGLGWLGFRIGLVRVGRFGGCRTCLGLGWLLGCLRGFSGLLGMGGGWRRVIPIGRMGRLWGFMSPLWIVSMWITTGRRIMGTTRIRGGLCSRMGGRVG